jgi:hypothetical protein
MAGRGDYRMNRITDTEYADLHYSFTRRRPLAFPATDSYGLAVLYAPYLHPARTCSVDRHNTTEA